MRKWEEKRQYEGREDNGNRREDRDGKEGLLDMLDRPSLFSSSLRGGDPFFVDQSNRERER